MMLVLETDRLILKKGSVEDWIKVHEYDFNYLMNIDGIFEYVRRTPEEVRSWFDNSLDNVEQKNNIKDDINKNTFDFIIFIKNGMIPVGYISFDRNNAKLKSTEVACYMHPNHWGKGYMTETLIECMKYLFTIGFENIIYSYDDGNIRSMNLCEKIGFEPFKQSTENNCFGTSTILYSNIMSKEKFGKLYSTKKVR